MGQTSNTNSTLIARAIRAARLDAELYEEVEHDRGATRQAAVVVVGTALLAGLGSVTGVGIAGLLFVTVASLVGWAVYAWLAYFIGTRLFADTATSADWGELARTLGFAHAPRALLITGVVPVLGAIVGLIVAFWVLATTIVAIRAALDFSTGRAIGTAVVAWIGEIIILGIAFALLG
jgi:hypothetical protein